MSLPDAIAPAAAQALTHLAPRIQQLLGDNLRALYLHGSAVWGDFDPEVSDLDLLAVVQRPITEADLPALKAMHDAFAADFPAWHDRIEVQYFTPEGLAHFRQRATSMANISPGEPLHIIDSGHDWLSNWYFVQRYGVTLLGDPPARYIPPIEADEFIAVVRDYAAYFATHTDYGSDSLPSQAYAILTLCRALYTVVHREQVSKQAAAAWASATYPDEAEIINDALRWRMAQRHPQSGADAMHARTAGFVHRMFDHVRAVPT